MELHVTQIVVEFLTKKKMGWAFNTSMRYQTNKLTDENCAVERAESGIKQETQK